MSVRKPIIKNGLYYGNNISDADANRILRIRNAEAIPEIKNKIFKFPPSLVLRSIEECKSIRRIIQEENIDYTQYIGELKDFQTTGTAFMYYSINSMIGDGVGMGKTAEVSALINILKERGELHRFLMAVETSAVGQTQAELMQFTGLYVIFLPSEAHLMKPVIEKTDWTKVDGVIIKHSTLRSDLFSRWLSLYLDEEGKSRIFDLFLLDESSVIKNNDTKTYRYTNNICNIVGRVHMMNATAFEICIMDIYYQIDMMYPTLLPSKSQIETKYATYKMKPYWKTIEGKPEKKFSRQRSGYKNQEEFKQSLQLVYLARPKRRPENHMYQVSLVEPTAAQTLAIAKNNGRYDEILNCPSLVPNHGIKCNRKDVPKIERLLQMVEGDFHDYQIMIYCFHLEAQKALADELISIGKKVVIINGSTPDLERWAIQQDFNAGKYDILVTNIRKSLNLAAAEVCIIYSAETNPAKMEQIRGRIDRSTDDTKKIYILMVYIGTPEYVAITKKVAQRAKDARSLTVDAKSAIDYFMESMESSN